MERSYRPLTLRSGARVAYRGTASVGTVVRVETTSATATVRWDAADPAASGSTTRALLADLVAVTGGAA